MLVQPYAAQFWGEFRSTLIGRLRHLDLYGEFISVLVYGTLLVHNLVLLYPQTPQRQRYDDTQMNEYSQFGPLEAMNDASPPHKQRPQSISIDPILTTNGPNSPRRPPPSNHLPGSPSARVSFESPQISASPTKMAHSRSKSVIDSPRRLNRLSMSFPVLPPNAAPSRPTSWTNSPVLSPTEPSPSVEGNFLTQLASQERRVLELKEALRQAEVELDRLKRYWASHEAHKKRGDVRRVQALQPLSANLSSLEASEDDVDGSSQWLQKEMERRKALLSGIKTSNRKVFSGSKHTRTLSLLSPEKSTFSQPFPQPADIRRSEDNLHRSPELKRSSLSMESTRPQREPDDTLPAFDGPPSKDVLLRTGKQMATDIRDGLWTFFEDIRQATIGEEATMSPGNASQQKGPKPLKRSNTTGTASSRYARAGRASTTTNAPRNRQDAPHDTLIDIGGSFWRENGVETPVSKVKEKAKPSKHAGSKKTASPLPSGELDAEPWDNWDTPIRRTPSSQTPHSDNSSSEEQADSASDGMSTPMTDEHSRPTPRTSTSSIGNKRNSIPWPDLEKLTPGNLKRTASHLMREWEKSLTPSPGESYVDNSVVFSSGGKTDKSD
jgi:hypothetical protein